MTHWESVIGLEVHVQLQTQSKIFSGASTHYGAEPNTQACAVDIALPGILPVMNRTAVHMAATFGLATGATINHRSVLPEKTISIQTCPKVTKSASMKYLSYLVAKSISVKVTH